MARSINLNADLGEGFGPYQIGDDEAMLSAVASANIACGFHAGDPSVMRHVVERARARGVSIGAHPGFNDVQGFGRRRIDLSPAEIEDMVAYQIGALQAVAVLAGGTVTHVKPHGALSNIAAGHSATAAAIARAIHAVDRTLIFVAIAGSEMEQAGRMQGLTIAREGFCDRQYEDAGALASRKIPGTVYHDPKVAVRQALELAEGRITTRSGKVVACEVDTLCIHGDEPTGAAIARAVRAALEEAGYEIAPLPALALA